VRSADEGTDYFKICVIPARLDFSGIGGTNMAE
jgi:hypothetical protein